MTTFTPDRPDWTREDTASIVYEQEQFINPGEQFDFGLVGVASYTVLAISVDVGAYVALSLLYQLQPNALVPIMELAVTSDSNPQFSALLVAESPSYGGLVTIANLNPDSVVLVTVFSSNRVVAEPRYTLDSIPASVYTNGGAFVADTPQQLAGVGNFGSGYAANVNAAVTVDSSGDGVVSFSYRDVTGTQRMIPIATVTAAVVATVTAPLPFCTGQFWFTPTLDDPAGTITLQAYPART